MQEVSLGAGRIRYRDTGEGPVLVFVHGFAVNGELWRKVVPLLGGRRCVVPDWPLGSHALAMEPEADLSPPALAALVAEFLEALDLDEVTLVGNDLGGAICQLVAAHHPERLARLVLTPCDAFDNFPPPTFRYLSWLAHTPGAPWVVAQGLRLPGLRRLHLTYGSLSEQGVPDEVLEGYVRPMIEQAGVRRDAAKVFAGLAPHHTLGALEGLRRFDKPVTLAWAREDRFFPFEHAERLAVVFPRAEVVPIEGALTFVSEDAPAALAAVLLA